MVYLGLHLFGRGDIVLPEEAAYDGEAYNASFFFGTNLPAYAYDAISVYDHYGRRLNLIPLPGKRNVRAGDTTRARVETDEYDL